MIQYRAVAGRINIRIGNHTIHATGIIAYLKNKRLLERAQAIPITPRRGGRRSTTAGRTRSRSTK